MSKGAAPLEQAGTDPQIYYLHVRFSVLRQNHRSFVLLMERLLSVIDDLYGWEFVHGSYPISGEVNRFVHVWKIPNPVDVLHIMRHGAFNEKAVDEGIHTKTDRDSKEYKYFRAIYWELQALITETTHLLTTALPADPNYEGYQTQTLLVERGNPKDPKWYLLDHKDMKAKWKSKDVRACLDALQFYERRERWAEEGPPKEETKPKDPFANYEKWQADEDFRRLKGRLQLTEQEAIDVEKKVSSAAKSSKPPTPEQIKKAKAEEKAKRAKKFERCKAATYGEIKGADVHWDAVEKIRELLNFGATHASVTTPLSEGTSATLVNLSALKPRSVQQEGYVPPDSARQPLTTDSNLSADLASTGDLLIVAPWGSIYCVNSGDVAAIAKTVDFSKDPALKKAEKHTTTKKKTDERVEAFTKAQIPLGSILEPRAGQIGDGCACYVINLNAIPDPGSASR